MENRILIDRARSFSWELGHILEELVDPLARQGGRQNPGPTSRQYPPTRQSSATAQDPAPTAHHVASSRDEVLPEVELVSVSAPIGVAMVRLSWVTPRIFADLCPLAQATAECVRGEVWASTSIAFTTRSKIRRVWSLATCRTLSVGAPAGSDAKRRVQLPSNVTLIRPVA